MNMRQNTAERILPEKTFREAERERGGNDAFASSRECSWADFNALPLPNRRMEEWRFASLSGVRFEDFSLPGGAVPAALAQDLVARSRVVPETAGTPVFPGEPPPAAPLDPPLGGPGVVRPPPPAPRVARPKTPRRPGRARAWAIPAPSPPAAAGPTTTMMVSAATMTMACMKSEALSARKPPMMV